MELSRNGYAVFDPTAEGRRWAEAARHAATQSSADPEMRHRNLRHGQTWFVGVDALPNAADGSVDGVPLDGAWREHVPPLPLHRAQLSIIYPGYPGGDLNESTAAHRYRRIRQAAHVDGLLPVGAARRRHAREYHAYVLGLPLNPSDRAPTMVWPGSHRIMQEALSIAIGDSDPFSVDITDAYHAARRNVLDQVQPVALCVPPGGAFLLHRFVLHGTAPWAGAVAPARMIAFFRPEFETANEWLT